MRLLLDTHAYIWTISRADKLSPPARLAIADPSNGLYLSIASLWEATIKIAKGTLQVPGQTVDFLLNEMAKFQVHLLPISVSHLRVLQTLPRLHGDPFDRILVAQSMAESLPTVTADRTLGNYQVETIWN